MFYLLPFPMHNNSHVVYFCNCWFSLNLGTSLKHDIDSYAEYVFCVSNCYFKFLLGEQVQQPQCKTTSGCMRVEYFAFTIKYEKIPAIILWKSSVFPLGGKGNYVLSNV